MARETISAEQIADIYEAAVDDARWPSMAKIVTAAAGIPSGSVWIVQDGAVTDFSITNDGKAAQAPYLAHYNKLDVWNQGLMRGPWEVPRLGYENFPERELFKTEFYNDFARHYGMFRPMGAMVRLGPKTFATVATIRLGTRKTLEEAHKPNLIRVLPYVKRALQLRVAQHRLAPHRRLHAATLDRLAFGVVVCNASGRIVLVNRAAEATARGGAGIVLGGAGKGLGALVPAEARALAALAHDAANGGPGGIMRITGAPTRGDLVVLVTPLPPHFGVGGQGGEGHALLTFRQLRDDPSFSSDMLAAIFGLSEAQAAVALAIFNGASPEQIAADRGVAVSTIRTHLAEVFVRTGAENQRDLVRLLGMLPPVRVQSHEQE